MLVRQVKDDTGWKKLLAYYIDCLREESRLHHVIGPEDIQKTCWFLPRTDGSFLRNAPFFSISIQQNREAEVERLQRFVLGEPRSEKRPHVCFGYPFFVDLHRNLIPLFYVDVSGRQINKGVWLTSKSPEVEINFATLREVLSEGLDDDEKEISRDKALVEFGELESESSKTRFDQALGLFLSRLEKSSGKPVVRVSRKQFESRSLPRHAVVECPLLFYARADGTNPLLRELRQLKEEHDWNAVQPALRHLLSKSSDESYPEASELGDPHLYIVPANDSQRKAVATAGQCSLRIKLSHQMLALRSWAA